MMLCDYHERVLFMFLVHCSSTREIELDKTGIGRRIKSRNKPIPTNGRRVTPSNPANLTGATPPSGHTPPVLGHTRPQGNNHAQKPGNPELMKRPLR